MVIPNFSAFRSVFSTVGTLDPDGYARWPVAKVRSGGFTGGLSGINKPIILFPIQVSCNALAVDGGAAFDWYLSQRSDATAHQYLSITQVDLTRSGTVTIQLTSLAVTALGLTLPTDQLTEDKLVRLLRDVTLYVQRRSDDAIQLVQMLPYTLGAS